MASSLQGLQKPRVPTMATPERMSSNMKALTGEESEAAVTERPLVDSDSVLVYAW